MTVRASLIGIAAAVFLIGCVNKDANDGDDQSTKSSGFEWVAMLANYADNLIIPQYQTMVQQSDELASDSGPLATYCALVGTEQEASALEQAQVAWRETMDVWQRAELFHLGPAAANGGALRNRIYAYGTSSSLSTCAVDQSVVLAQGAGFDVTARSFNSRGLAAIEYLLFREDLAHTCPAQITQTQDWNQRPDVERKALRCQYALDVAQDIHTAAGVLHDAWQSDGQNYRFQFVHPSEVEDNLKALSDALFYIETDTKDAKVGVPTGIHADCSQVVCPSALESIFSESSLTNIRHNLLAFEQSLIGGEGLGFDDIMIKEGFPEVVEQFRADVEQAVDIIDASETSLYQQLLEIEQSGDGSVCLNSAANPADAQGVPACRLHGVLKRITDRMRIDFVAIVDLDLPDRAQSDND